jgi:2-polyprenyl-3-methyl-5-hydroxy-6-metoxy-1,4-benzoquinol methylase
VKAEKMWDSMAKSWDKPGAGLGAGDKRLVEKTKRYLQSGGTVLDYGCASGTICLELAKDVKQAYGVDISSKMIEIAQKRAEENKAANTTFIHGSIFNEGLKKESFDVITAFNILHLVEDIPQVMQRIYTLLKPGGTFITATPCLGQKKPSVLLMEIPVWIASKTGILPHVNFFTIAKLTDAVNAANLKVSETECLKNTSLVEYFIAAKKG